MASVREEMRADVPARLRGEDRHLARRQVEERQARRREPQMLQLRFHAEVGHEDEAPAVGGPPGLLREEAVVGEPLQLRAVGPAAVEVGPAAELAGEGDPLAVRREGGADDAVQLRADPAQDPPVLGALDREDVPPAALRDEDDVPPVR